MSQPAVRQTELDGALGILPPSSGDMLAVLGVSSTGPVATPAAYGSVSALVADFGSGPLVEAAARHIETTGNRVIVVRTGQTTSGDVGTIDDDDVAGTSVITETTGNAPVDDYEIVVEIVTGGTRGTTGITYRTSLDGGRTWGAVTALGTATALAIPGTGVSFDLAAGTLVAGDTWSCRTTAPAPNGTELGAAIDALRVSALPWELLHIATPLDATLFDTVETAFSSLASSGKYRAWIASVRMPNAGETEAQYLTAQSTAFASKATKVGELCAGACKLVSSVSRRTYRRPVSFVVASREANVPHHINIADINLGPITGCSIRDENGNPDEHDESINPGLDDARFTVLRTWEGIAGVYVNRPRIFSAEGSDFDIMPKRRVMNLARRATRAYLQRRLNQPIQVDRTTGFILEEEAQEIEAGGNAALAGVLSGAPKASGWSMVLSRTDNLLSTKTLTVTDRIVPLAYVEFIEEQIGFENPALQVQAVG
ncbi:DUF2586 family protein [Sandaracinus amylolyticus]|uniref:Tail sheath protein subtilisin-like domain-containing protein n=1 Tax=Sandaracinus amylolyticus TaxID=927083 RepID=A0A0F6W355_9BACT|nr:DUF2586 family protein [Sandaracinus amylolyticus]AKF06077.1 hypothetical protein DB32_003226 [Sandaracinus amylolyticus]